MPWESAKYVLSTTAANLNSAGYAKGAKGLQIAEGMSTPYYQWDATKIRGCVCDARYGDVDCSKRICPYGTDVLDVRDDLTLPQKYQMQELVFVADDETYSNQGSSYKNTLDASGIYSTGLKGQTFALTFRSRLNESFTTIPIVFDPVDLNDFVHDIQVALLTLPNRVIDGVTVAAGRYLTTAASYSSSAPFNPDSIYGGSPDADGNVWSSSTYGNVATRNEIRVNVTFTGPSVQGPQHLIKIESYECQNGCTPKLSGLRLQTRANHLQSNVTEMVLADFNSYECGRRGKCDYTSGLCACFLGYTGEACGTLTTLV
jgi:hypothetical protein